ncbi:MAG: hypothetical protein CMM58_02385 [Rhodospirillaceae bacterium]|nr:hypothetical protein [Rhodospirillaceae bacterium]|tara:strand:- start:3525 stop:4160 length:636 start_codon:yes stop_codon:yes gene_type:complete
MDDALSGYVKKLTHMKVEESSLDVYEAWASSYETTMIGDYGYSAPGIAVSVLMKCGVKTSHQILDLGGGTGLVGLELVKHGFKFIDGLDFSPKMLQEAANKAIYGNLLVADMTKPINFTDQQYDAAIGVGCFGNGHVGVEHIKNITANVKSDGIIVLYVNGIPFEEDNYRAQLEDLERREIWDILLLENSNYMNGRDRPGWTVAARKLERS